jgi:uncharacterized protein YmfQ (DUF2313 family)
MMKRIAVQSGGTVIVKPDKGHFGGSCNRTACQAPNATWWHMDTHAYYCRKCAFMLNVMHAADALRLYGGPLLREHSAEHTPKVKPEDGKHDDATSTNADAS